MLKEIRSILDELAEMAVEKVLRMTLPAALDKARDNRDLEDWVWGPMRGIVVITSRVLHGWEYVFEPEELMDWLGSPANEKGRKIGRFERIARAKLLLTQMTGLPSRLALEQDPAAVLFLAAMGGDAVLYGGSWCEGSVEVATSGLTARADEECSRLIARAFQELCSQVVQRLQEAGYGIVQEAVTPEGPELPTLEEIVYMTLAAAQMQPIDLTRLRKVRADKPR